MHFYDTIRKAVIIAALTLFSSSVFASGETDFKIERKEHCTVVYKAVGTVTMDSGAVYLTQTEEAYLQKNLLATRRVGASTNMPDVRMKTLWGINKNPSSHSDFAFENISINFSSGEICVKAFDAQTQSASDEERSKIRKCTDDELRTASGVLARAARYGADAIRSEREKEAPAK